MVDPQAVTASLRLPNGNQDLHLLYTRVLDAYHEKCHSHNTRSQRLERENEKLAERLRHTEQTIHETENHLNSLQEVRQKIKTQHQLMSQQLEQYNRDAANTRLKIDARKKAAKELDEQSENLVKLYQTALGVRLLNHGDGSYTLILDCIISQRESVACCIQCVQNDRSLTLIPKRVEPHFPGMTRFLNYWGGEGLHACAYVARVLFKHHPIV